MAIITPEEFRSFTSLSPDIPVPEETLAYLEPASLIVEKYLGYSVGDGTSETVLTRRDQLEYYFVLADGTDITSLVYTSRGGNPVTIAPDDYFTDGLGMVSILNNPDIASSSNRGIEDNGRLVLTQGSSSAPDDVKLAVALLTRYYAEEKFNLQSVSFNGQAVQYQDNEVSIPQHIRAILNLSRLL